jgi:molybdopterin biosynthesis enzyme
MVVDSSNPRILRLTPLDNVLAAIDSSLEAVKPERRAPAHALGYAFAEDIAATTLPTAPVALRDGFAVEAAALADANSYAPVSFAAMPSRIDAGETLPNGADAVLPLDAVSMRGDRAEAIAAVAEGDGVLAAGGDVSAPMPLRRAGERMRAVDLAAITAAGIADVMARVPHVSLACGGAARSAPIEAAFAFLAHAGRAAGADVVVNSGPSGLLDAALMDSQADAIIAVGGTGSGRHDSAVNTLARLGRVDVHGFAVSPGETAAYGFVGACPVLLIPGRLDAALAIWLLVGRHLVAKLAGGRVEDVSTMLPLKRKVTSTIGLTELIPVRCSGGMAEPLASGYLSLQSLALSDGWIVVPANSEGFPAGSQIAVKPWP